MQAFRSVAPRAPITIDGAVFPVKDEILGATTGLSLPIPGEFDGQTVGVSYTASAHRPTYAIGRALDPAEPGRARPDDVFLGSVRLSWSYSNAFRPLYGISAERGVFLALSSDFAGAATGSDASLLTIDARAIGYLPAPWFRHHVFALALTGGAATGSFPGRGYYYSGGYYQQNTFDAVTTGLRQSAFVLRGYPPGTFFGRQFNLVNLEYRFPLIWPDRGLATLPAFLHGAWGTLFADYGGAYDHIEPGDYLAPFHLGVGAELNVEFTLGYFVDSGLRFGIAKGFGEFAYPGVHTYVVVAASF
jgi:outer membrane protein assembly factor BamA